MGLNAFYDETRVDVESHAPGATQIFLKFTSPTNRALFPREKGKGNSRNFVKSAFNDQNRNQPAFETGASRILQLLTRNTRQTRLSEQLVLIFIEPEPNFLLAAQVFVMNKWGY